MIADAEFGSVDELGAEGVPLLRVNLQFEELRVIWKARPQIFTFGSDFDCCDTFRAACKYRHGVGRRWRASIGVSRVD